MKKIIKQLFKEDGFVILLVVATAVFTWDLTQIFKDLIIEASK